MGPPEGGTRKKMKTPPRNLYLSFVSFLSYLVLSNNILKTQVEQSFIFRYKMSLEPRGSTNYRGFLYINVKLCKIYTKFQINLNYDER